MDFFVSYFWLDSTYIANDATTSTKSYSITDVKILPFENVFLFVTGYVISFIVRKVDILQVDSVFCLK